MHSDVTMRSELGGCEPSGPCTAHRPVPRRDNLWPYGVQDKSDPAVAVENIDASAGHRICDEPPPLTPAPPDRSELGVLPTEEALGAPAPVVGLPSWLVVLCAPPDTRLLVALGPLNRAFAPVPTEGVLTDGVAPMTGLLAVLGPLSKALAPGPTEGVIDGLVVPPTAGVVVAFGVVTAEPVPVPAVVVVCAATGGTVRAARRKAAVRARMVVNP